MGVERKPVTIHYRKFNRASGVTSTLEALVRQAMNSSISGELIKNRYMLRVLTIGSDNYFINTYKDDYLVFGDILHFTKGHLQALCKITNPNVSSVPVQQMTAPAQSEYVHSQMFWLIKGDHVFVIQSLSLKTEDLEKYLDWLLRNKTDKLSLQVPLTLVAKFDEDKVGGDLNDIQEIIVGGMVSSAYTSSEVSAIENASIVKAERSIDLPKEFEDVTQIGQLDTAKTTGWDTARSVLKVLLGGDANVESLMKSVPPDADLNVQVHIGYRTKKRKEVSRAAMNQLEIGLRNLPDSQLQIKAKGAKVAADGTIRLHYNASITLVKVQDGDKEIIGTLLDPVDVLRAMVEAHNNLVANGKIQE